jgi:uracil-DNA glycosylase
VFDPLSAAAVFGPLAVEAGKALINKYLAPGEFKPATIDQYVKMREIDLEMFKALNDAGGSNASYPWVDAIVRLMRPTVAVIVLGTWAWSKLAGTPSEAIDNFAAAIGFYLFGDRTLFYARKGLQK